MRQVDILHDCISESSGQKYALKSPKKSPQKRPKNEEKKGSYFNSELEIPLPLYGLVKKLTEEN